MTSPGGTRTLPSILARLVLVLALLGTVAMSAIPTFADSIVTAGALQVTQISSAPIVAKQPATFTISVTNTTPALAGGVTLGDTLPAGMSIVTLLGPGGNPDLCARTRANGITGFACSMGDLAPGASATLSFTGIPTQVGTELNTAVAQGCTGLLAAIAPGTPCATAGGLFTTISSRLPFQVLATAPAPAPATVPAAPTTVNATAGNAQASVTWSPPLSDGGSAITSYTVTSSPAGATVTVAAPATSATLTGLTNGISYTFTVTATNGVGTSAASAPSNSVTPTGPVIITVPTPPTGVTAAAGDAQATVTWTAPLSDGGSAITSYTLSVATANGAQPAVATSVSVAAPATSATVTGLTNGTSYTFTVTATNAVGTSAASAASNSVTPAAAVVTGPLPTDVQVTGSAVPNSAGVGRPITYVFQVKNNGNATASGVTLTDALHAGETFVLASPNCSQAAGVVSCQIGSLARGASSFVVISVKAPTTPGIYTEVASVSETNVDTRPSNNTASVTVQAR